jgi:hypothetical protein
MSKCPLALAALLFAGCGAHYPEDPGDPGSTATVGTGDTSASSTSASSPSGSTGTTTAGSSSGSTSGSSSSSGGELGSGSSSGSTGGELGSGSSSGGTTGASYGSDTWSSFAKPFFDANCARCHASTFDSFAYVQTHQAEIRANIESGKMPKNGALSASDRAQILAWFDCGLPQ